MLAFPISFLKKTTNTHKNTKKAYITQPEDNHGRGCKSRDRRHIEQNEQFIVSIIS